MTGSEPLKDGLARLKAEFAERLPGRLAEIESAKTALADASGEAQVAALKNLAGMAHKLAGSAGTFGYPDLGSAARAVNDFAKDVLSGGGTPLDAGKIARVVELTDRMMASAGNAAPSPSPGTEPEVRRTESIGRASFARAAYIPTALTALGILLTGVYADRLNERRFIELQRVDVFDKLSTIRSRLEGYIHTNISLVKGFSVVTAIEPNMTQERFESLAGPLLTEQWQLRSIGVAPDMVVRYVFPLKGNEGAIGLDIGNHPDQRDAALRARNLGEIILAGPIDLVQGGRGFIGRFPVFVAGGSGRAKRFWGLISAVIDEERLYDAVGLRDERLPIEIAIRGKDGWGAKGELFFGQADVFRSAPELASVHLPDGTWQMAAVPKGGWPARADNAWTLRFAFALGGSLIVLSVAFTTRLFRQRQDSHERLTTAIESMDSAVALYDAADRLVVFNRRYRELLGPVAALVAPGITFERLLRELVASTRYLDTATDKEKFISRRLAAHRQAKGEPAYRLAGGTWIRVDEYRTSDGGTFIFVRDITATRLAEEALKASEERFRELTTISSDWIWETGPDGRFTYLSDGFSGLTGHPKTRLLGKTREDFVVRVPGDEELWENHRRAIAERRAFRGLRYRYHRPDGTIGWISIRGGPVFGADGKFQGYRGAAREITQRMRNEQELREAKEAADAANRAKSDFLSNMSHELRTPLNAILGFGQLLKYNPKEPLTETQTTNVDIILKGGQHLLTLITEILDLAKIEAGKVTLSIEDVSARALFDDVRTMIAPTAEKSKIALDIAAPEPDIRIRADHTRAKQVLLNLVSNAVKYNFEGGRVSVKIAVISGDRARIDVADTGPGIAPDKQLELFQPFNRLGAEATGIEGTGIGLALSKKLVEMMDGAIGFKSEIGVGSTFWIEWPLSAGRDKPEPKGQSGSLPGSGEEAPFPGGTILYVEDNPENLRLMELIFERIEGVTLLSADNAELGLLIAEQRKPDMIIMDINLPGMNGFEALERLKSHTRTSAIPVVALSANATAQDIAKGAQSGFFRYLTKPVDVVQLLDTVREALDGRP
jgi:PAS domain S-box-containing protein